MTVPSNMHAMPLAVMGLVIAINLVLAVTLLPTGAAPPLGSPGIHVLAALELVAVILAYRMARRRTTLAAHARKS